MPCRTYLVGCILAFALSNATATVITYQFEAKVESLFEYNGVSKQIVHVGSSIMPGSLISLDDRITGQFTYDTGIPQSPYYQPDPGADGSYLIYSGGINSALVFDASGLTYHSNSDSWQSTVQVANNASVFRGADILSFSTSSKWSPSEFSNMTLNMFDRTGQVFATADIPAQLSLGSFGYTNLDYGWLRKSDGSQVHASGSLTSLSLVEPGQAVPEPSTVLLTLVGLASFALSASRRISANTKT